MKKIQSNTIYQCSFCGFEDPSPKVVGKHEWQCRHNTIVSPAEKIRREQRQELYQSESIHELNTKLLVYIDTYFPDLRRKWSDSSIKFSISKKYSKDYTLYTSYPTAIQAKLGIKYTLSDYPTINRKLIELEDLREKYTNQKQKFFDARDKALNERIYTSQEYLEYQNTRNELVLQKKQIEKKIDILANAHQQRVDQFYDDFKKEYGYIDYNLKDLEGDLGL